MAYVNTVLGSIHPDEMGVTSPHEHILWGPPGWEYDPEWWFHYPKVLEKCVVDMKAFRELGGKTTVDCAGIGLGRDVEFYRMVSKYSGVNVVVSTGFWQDTGIYNYFRDKDIDYMEELFVREITQGIGDTGVKAGVIKVGNSIYSLTELEEHLHRAAARAAKRTGCAVVTHGMQWLPEQILGIFQSEGLDLSRVIASHCDGVDSVDPERDKKFARMGVWVAYDCFGWTDAWYFGHYADADEGKADRFKLLVDAGCTNRLLIAAEPNLFSLGWKRSAPYVGSHTIEHLLRVVPDKLRRIGISEDLFWKIMTENPKQVIPIQ
ncbi:phosphotriesterase [Chloroflexota bacterium]